MPPIAPDLRLKEEHAGENGSEALRMDGAKRASPRPPVPPLLGVGYLYNPVKERKTAQLVASLAEYIPL
jgi:hypothetical protein